MTKVIKRGANLMLAVALTLTVKYNAHAADFKQGQTVAANKVWTIKFNKPVKLDAFTQRAIQVVDSQGIAQDVQLQLSSDKKSILVKPSLKGYKSGEKHTLKISKALKSETNLNLKSDVSMEFSIKEGAGEPYEKVEGTSFNNVRNSSLVVQDETWTYYVNIKDNNSIYKMRKDGTSNQMVYQGNGNIYQLYIVGDSLVFIDRDKDFKEDVFKICKMKKDGTGEVQDLYKEIWNICKMQVDGEDIYFGDPFNFYKGNIRGNEAIKLLNKIENNSDEINFSVKDGWIYYWGANYRTYNRTGIYKMMADGTQKQRLLSSSAVKDLSVDSVNIDNGYLYYSDTKDTLYRVDLNGDNYKNVVSIVDKFNMNVFKDWVYYSTQEGIYKIKIDGAGSEKIANKVSSAYPAINIVGESLYYYDESNVLRKISLGSEENGSGGTTSSLSKGDTFFIKGVNEPSSQIIEYASDDVNGDGKTENVILTGTLNDDYYSGLTLFIQNPLTGTILSYNILRDIVNCEYMGNEIIVGDFNGDKVKDIMVNFLTNKQRGIQSTLIYSLSNNHLSVIFNEYSISQSGKDFNYELLSDYNLKISNGKNAYHYLVNLSNCETVKELQKEGREPVSPGITVYYEAVDTDKDGVLELQRNLYLVGYSYSDFLCCVKTTYKFNATAESWEYKNFEVNSDYNPCKKVETGSEVDNCIPQGRIQGKDGWIYYVHYYYSCSSNNQYSLDRAVLYKVKEDGSEKKAMAEGAYYEFGYDGEYIYYISMSDHSSIHKVRLDGTQDTRVCSDEVYNIDVSGDYIYYSIYGGGIYKIKKDGTEKIKLGNDNPIQFKVYENWIYYITSDTRYMYKLSADGSQRVELSDESCYNLTITKDGIYYAANYFRNYKMNYDGTNKKELDTSKAIKYNDAEWYYYMNSSDSGRIYKMKLDGTEQIQLTKEEPNDFMGMVGDWIFYTAGNTEDQHVYKVHKNGGTPQLIN